MDFKHSCLLAIDSCERVMLSLATDQAIAGKNPALKEQTLPGRMTVEEHLLKLANQSRKQGCPIDPAAPILAISCRNVLANLRCGAWVKDQTKAFLTVAEEDPLQAQRAYHVLGRMRDRLVIEEFLPLRHKLHSYEWMISGVPVWWNGEPVFHRILTEASDLSHVFELPRGHSPLATENTNRQWERLHRRFRDLLNAPQALAYRQMRKETRALRRENDYLHNIIGVTKSGQLRVLVANGRLERLGLQIAKSGATRALMVDNGGSSSVFYFPQGFRRQSIQLIAAPNYRPLGTAFLVVVRP